MNLGEDSFIESIESEKLIDLAEVLIDNELPEGLIKEIPILSTVVGVVKTVSNIRDKLFVKKIIRFLEQLSNIELAERKKFVHRILKNERDKKILSENILLLIDKITDVDKIDLISQVVIEYIYEKISRDELEIMLIAVEKCPLTDILKIPDFDKFSTGDRSDVLDRYFSAGLCGLHHASGTFGGGSSFYCSNNITEIAIRIVNQARKKT